jgi:hypothetical protein
MDPARTASPPMPTHACWPARRKRSACWRAYAQWPAKPAHEDVEPPGGTQKKESAQVEEEEEAAGHSRRPTSGHPSHGSCVRGATSLKQGLLALFSLMARNQS